MSRRVQIVILCEDTQHECFLRRFFERRGFNSRGFRVERLPGPRGAKDAWVRDRFPVELREVRRVRVDRALAVMIDGDRFGVARRMAELDETCLRQGVPPRESADRVAVFVPTWNIETWLMYLGGAAVQEDQKDYPRLSRERDCGAHVSVLARMCDGGALRQPAPASLQSACEEFRFRIIGGEVT